MTHKYQQPHDADQGASSSFNYGLPNLSFFEGGVAAVEFGRTVSSAIPPPEFRPVLEGRLFTAHDATLSADCKVHPAARLSYDSLPQLYRDVFTNCRMYLEKHLDFVRYLHYLSLDKGERRSEPATERQLIQSLGISVNTEEGDKKKWQCGVVGCEYRGTLQHLASHLRTKSHIGIRTFSCTFGCKILFHHPQDRDRHVKERICMKSRPVQDPTEPNGLTRSVRGAQGQPASAPNPRLQPRQSVMDRQSQIPAQTPTQGITDLRTRNYVHCDPRLRAHGNCATGAPSTSSAPPQRLVTPLHLTTAYHQAHSLNVSPTQHEHAELYAVYHAPPTPDIFPAISQTNFDGTHANIITNNNYAYGTTENPQPANNPQFTPLNARLNHSTAVIHGHPRLGLRMATGYQAPGQLNPAYFVANIYGGDQSQNAHGRSHDPRQPQQYEAQTQGPSSHRNEGGGRAGKRPCTSMSSGLTSVAPCEALSTIADSFPHRFTDEHTSPQEYRESPPVLRAMDRPSPLTASPNLTSQHRAHQVRSRQLYMLLASLRRSNPLNIRGGGLSMRHSRSEVLCDFLVSIFGFAMYLFSGVYGKELAVVIVN